MKYEKNIDLKLFGKIRAVSPDFQRKRREAIAISRRELCRANKAYAAISGGKDSIALLGIVAEAARDSGKELIAWAHVSDASFPGTEETITKACEIVDVAIYFDRSPVSAYEVFRHDSQKKYGKEGYFFSAIKSFLELGFDLAFTGVRAAESRRRRQAAEAHGVAYNTKVPAPHRKCEPLAWWSIEDVAAAIHYYKLPIHPIYGKRCMTEIPIRLGYITAADWAADQAPFLRANYPEQFRKLAEIYPEIRNYV